MWKRILAGAAAAALLSSAAQAAEFVLELEGDVSTLSTSSFTFNGDSYETGSLLLEGYAPFSLNVGDTIVFNITLLNGPLFIPGRPDMLVGLDFFLPEPPAGDPLLSGSLNFDNGYFNGGACGNCLAVIVGLPAGLDFSFSGLTGDALVEALNGPVEVGSIRLSYQLVTPGVVPEPATWAMMIGGFGLLGGVLRRRAPVPA